MTLEQQRAIALASARLRLQESATFSGVAAEGAKGLVRGASDVGMTIGKGVAGVLDPTGFLGAQRGVEALAAPSRSLVQARPANEPERFAGTAGELAGASVAGAGVTRPISNVVLPAVAGAAGEQVAGEPGKIAGALSPLALQAVPGAIRRVARGPQAPAAERLSTLQSVGANPTLADIAPSRANVQAIAGRVPMSAEITNKAIETQAKQLGDSIDNLIPSAGTTPLRAGEAVQEGLSAWKKDFYKNWEKLDERTKTLLGNPTVPIPETLTKLTDLSRRIDNPALNEIFQTPKIVQLQEVLSGGTSPVNTLFQLRREIGKQVGSKFNQLKSDFDVGELKALYSAISKDIEGAARATGNPEVLKAIQKQNKYYETGSDRISTFYERLSKQANPERVFDLLESGTKRGSAEIRDVMKAIPVEARDEIISLALSRMGQAKPSAQGAGGGKFSVDAFLTKWNQMNPEARFSLFAGSSNPSMLTDINKIAKAVSIAKESGKALFNPSGTGMVVGYGGSAGALLIAPIETLSVGAGVTAASYLMTNPRFVKWLAQGTTLPTQAVKGHVARLGQIANEEGGEFKDAVEQYSSTLQ